MHGFGPVEPEANEPLFHAEWEARVRAMMYATVGRVFNLDEFRYGIEQMPPADYLRSSYFERWLATVEYNLIEKGVLTSAELDARTALLQQQPDAELPLTGSVERPWQTVEEKTEPPVTEITPRFAVGDAIITRNQHPARHTRLPRYTRGKRGVIHLVHGPEVFADTNAHGLGQNPQVVYSVRFAARELWGDAAEPDGTLNIDLWESYLEPAPG
ncbi:MAG: nitrile hydratase subunit beta, partial [Chloroflexota bacterium]|nr:nitrile hydratase subunit beta [Chloroflexota bacterium]